MQFVLRTAKLNGVVRDIGESPCMDLVLPSFYSVAIFINYILYLYLNRIFTLKIQKTSDTIAKLEYQKIITKINRSVNSGPF